MTFLILHFYISCSLAVLLFIKDCASVLAWKEDLPSWNWKVVVGLTGLHRAGRVSAYTPKVLISQLNIKPFLFKS